MQTSSSVHIVRIESSLPPTSSSSGSTRTRRSLSKQWTPNISYLIKLLTAQSTLFFCHTNTARLKLLYATFPLLLVFHSIRNEHRLVVFRVFFFILYLVYITISLSLTIKFSLLNKLLHVVLSLSFCLPSNQRYMLVIHWLCSVHAISTERGRRFCFIIHPRFFIVCSSNCDWALFW